MLTFNDKLESRNIRHLNLLVAHIDNEDLIIPFKGQSIPGVVAVHSSKEIRNGRWSYTEWAITLEENIQQFIWRQDWHLGEYIVGKTWEAAFDQVQQIAKFPIKHNAIERFIRATMPLTAIRLDRVGHPLLNRPEAPETALRGLLIAQREKAAKQCKKL